MAYLSEDFQLRGLQLEVTVKVTDMQGGLHQVVDIPVPAAKVEGKSVAEIGSFLQRETYEALQVALQLVEGERRKGK